MPSGRPAALIFAGLCLLLPRMAAGQGLPVAGHGSLSIVLPAPWKEVQRHLPKDLPPTVEFERAGSPRGTLQVTALWSPKQDPAFTSPEKIRGLCLAEQQAFRDQAVEREFPLRPLAGTRGAGFFYEATDRTYRQPAGGPTPGEFPVLTHGELGLGSLILSFTILSDAKGDAAVAEGLAAMQRATLAPAGAASPLGHVQGGGIDLWMDLTGFTQKEGFKPYHGAYAQVGFYAGDGLLMSVLVDDLGGKTLADLEQAGLGQSEGLVKPLAGERPRSRPVDQPRGYLVSYRGAIPYRGVFQGQWYFETIHRGKWLELHFSKVFRDGEDVSATEAEVLRRVRSIQEEAPLR